MFARGKEETTEKTRLKVKHYSDPITHVGEVNIDGTWRAFEFEGAV